MKPIHFILFAVLLLIWWQKKNQIHTNMPVVSGDATLRRDMDEKYDLLLARLEELENSPYA